MSPSDPHRAEQEYLQRADAGGEWERFKPFSPPGHQTLAESTRLIQDFAVALTLLQPSPTDLVLDLGSGACWVTDWLARLNLRTVSLDIAIEMLRVGRTRVPASARERMAVGDMERLPFADGAFDKAICLGSLHHVPSMRAAVGEIARVLTSSGSVVFAEPGEGHSITPESVVAMGDFGVLEQDVLIADLMQDCRTTGFEDVRLEPASYVLRDAALTLDGWMAWNAWNRRAHRRRPNRVADHLRRAWRELVRGTSAPFGESFAADLSGRLAIQAELRPVILASKGPRIAQPPSVTAPMTARITVSEAPAQVGSGVPVAFIVSVVNSGDAIWLARASAEGKGHVRLGVQLLDEDQRLIDRDHVRVALPHDLAPGQAAELHVAFRSPTEPGVYAVKLDMVMEGVGWFEAGGSATEVHGLEVD